MAVKIGESRLAVLFEEIADCSAQKRFSDAHRLAESALRFAADNPTAILIRARTLLEVGQPEAAAQGLRGREDPETTRGATGIAAGGLDLGECSEY
jgi:thioredoxin-like negative regulator of GroEL